MEKLIRDGKVAILVSPGFGAGWYTWNTSHPECVFDPDIVKIVLKESEGGYGKIAELAEEKWDKDNDSFYPGGADDLIVVWLDKGTKFRIEEYDGSESLVTSKDLYLVE